MLLGVKPKRTVGPTNEVQLDYWEPAKEKLLSDSRLLHRLAKLKKDSLAAPQDDGQGVGSLAALRHR